MGAEDTFTFEMPDLFAVETTAYIMPDTARIMPDGRPVTGLFAELSPRTREAIGVDPYWGSVAAAAARSSESTIGHANAIGSANEEELRPDQWFLHPTLNERRVDLEKKERALLALQGEEDDVTALWNKLAALPNLMAKASGFVQQRRDAWEKAGQLSAEADLMSWAVQAAVLALEKEAGVVIDKYCCGAGADEEAPAELVFSSQVGTPRQLTTVDASQDEVVAVDPYVKYRV